MNLSRTLLAHPRWYAGFHRVLSQGKLEHLERAVSSLELDGQTTHLVLDLGCGPGTSASVFSKPGWEYRGIDLEPAYVAHARLAFPGRFEVGDVTRLEDLGQRFDLVLLNSVLHHLDDQGAEATLANAAVHLRPSGSLLLMDMVTPEGFGPGPALRRTLVRLDRGGHCRTAATLEEMIGRHFGVMNAQAFALSLGPVDLWEMRLYVCRRPTAR
ncbi:MAG: methyltransferase domain-containing protein [Deltaproteobacteria bacterium]|nr:methyltransferase domain-containing protein [Deltaproteobacteria bacterium]